MWFLRRMLRVSWTEKRTNLEIQNTASSTRKLMSNIKRRQAELLGHVMRKGKLEHYFVDNRKDRRKKKQRSSKNKNTRRYSSLAGKKHCGDVCGCKRSQKVEGHDRLRLQQTRQLMMMMMMILYTQAHTRTRAPRTHTHARVSCLRNHTRTRAHAHTHAHTHTFFFFHGAIKSDQPLVHHIAPYRLHSSCKLGWEKNCRKRRAIRRRKHSCRNKTAVSTLSTSIRLLSSFCIIHGILRPSFRGTPSRFHIFSGFSLRVGDVDVFFFQSKVISSIHWTHPVAMFTLMQ